MKKKNRYFLLENVYVSPHRMRAWNFDVKRDSLCLFELVVDFY